MSTIDPITPPPELVSEWTRNRGYSCPSKLWNYIATQAAQWGADQELEACFSWLALNGYGITASRLRAAHRPAPPSLKEQALADLDSLVSDLNNLGMGFKVTNIIRALEALPNE